MKRLAVLVEIILFGQELPRDERTHEAWKQTNHSLLTEGKTGSSSDTHNSMNSNTILRSPHIYKQATLGQTLGDLNGKGI